MFGISNENNEKGYSIIKFALRRGEGGGEKGSQKNQRKANKWTGSCQVRIFAFKRFQRHIIAAIT